MRIYRNFKEAYSEVRRDLGEMGILVHTTSYQNKDISGMDEFTTKELQNYTYQVTNTTGFETDLKASLPWAEHEFYERLDDCPKNPGDAYLLRHQVWEEFLNKDRRFDYTYGERLHTCGTNQIKSVIEVLKNDRSSRQAYISIWDNLDITNAGGDVRIPCSLGYLFQIRRDKLNITYLQRSSDFVTHFQNDVYLACKMQHFIAGKLNIETGSYTHWIGSLHAFKKDLADVF